MKRLLTVMLAMWLFACEEKNNVNAAESIAEAKYVDINGTKQFVMIRGEDSQKPVVLFVHGGPGVSEIGGLRKYNSDLEKDFVVVYWDQRNAGKSYVENFPKGRNQSK
jgi:pimeloyl-ACP methyl ester carboxylesterase